jgi:glycosyltransferase involved in cell wall biosynthesis
VKPHLGDKIKFIGEVEDKEKINLFSHGKEYLCPIQWDEPFGITMVEAMACGTPVVTFKRGSTSEVVAHGTTGFVVDTMDEFVDAVKHVSEINPRKCRERVESMFTTSTMVDNYERVYTKILGDR